MVEAGRRVTARHIREIEKAKVKKLVVPAEYFIGRTLAHDVPDAETGEVTG